MKPGNRFSNEHGANSCSNVLADKKVLSDYLTSSYLKRFFIL